MKTELPEDLQTSLKSLLDLCIMEDETTRDKLLRKWRRNEDYWNDMQFFFWDESVRDFRLPPEKYWEEVPKCFNILKAHGESIIAALSTGIPFVRFFPQDADNPDDISASRVWSNTSELIQKHNESTLLFMKALYILFLQDFVAAYNYNQADETYGTVETEQAETKMVPIRSLTCSECGTELTPEMMGVGADTCPVCGSTEEPIDQTTEQEMPVIVGVSTENRKREIIDVYGPMHIKIPLKARKQTDCGYLIHSCEQNFAQVKSVYSKAPIPQGGLTGYTEDQIARQRSDWYEDNPNNITVHRVWFRPWIFWLLKTEEAAQALLAKFPKGVKVTFAETSRGSYIFLDYEEEKMDDRWTISVSGTSDYLHTNAMCQSLIPIQDMTNKMRNLELETIEHGIPITFASPQVLDFDDFRSSEARPGDIYPTEDSPGGRPIGEHFYSTQATSLSKEVQFFAQQLEQDAQFVVGSFPSIYGGPSESSGGTAYEYETSKNQATQRLGLTWKNINMWWAKVMHKSVRSFLNNMVADESFVKQDNENFTTVWIKKALSDVGKVGQVEPEISENFPISTGQQRALLLELLQLQSEELNAVIYAPENSQFIAQTLGYPRIKIPGTDQRAKQFTEIQELLKGSPIEIPPDPMALAMGAPAEPQMMSSVQIEPEIDDDEIHIEILRSYLVGEIGQSLKVTNPAAYMNCIAHLKEHISNMEMKMAAAAPPEEETEEAPTEEVIQ